MFEADDGGGITGSLLTALVLPVGTGGITEVVVEGWMVEAGCMMVLTGAKEEADCVGLCVWIALVGSTMATVGILLVGVAVRETSVLGRSVGIDVVGRAIGGVLVGLGVGLGPVGIVVGWSVGIDVVGTTTGAGLIGAGVGGTVLGVEQLGGGLAECVQIPLSMKAVYALTSV